MNTGLFHPARLSLLILALVLLAPLPLAGSAPSPEAADVWIQAAKLTASDGGDVDRLGLTVAASGDGSTVVAGTPLNPWSDFYGAAYVFSRPAGGWTEAMTQTAKLTASDATYLDQLGWSVAVSGDGSVVATGMPNREEGAVYVFVRPPGGWSDATETAVLTVGDGTGLRDLGTSVAMSADGSTVVAGSYWSEPWNTSMGAVYVFERPPGGWSDTTEAAMLTSSDHADLDQLGAIVAVDGDGGTVVAGAPTKDNGDTYDERGAAYVFQRPLTGWASITETAKLTATDAADNDWLGAGVAVSADGETVAVGAQYNAAGGYRRGAIYVYVAPAEGWANGTETAKLTASDGRNQDKLGRVVGMSGDGANIVGGAAGRDEGGQTEQGAVYLFTRPPGSWAGTTEAAKFTASGGAAGDQFGMGAAISGDGGTVAAGAPDNDAGGQSWGGVRLPSSGL